MRKLKEWLRFKKLVHLKSRLDQKSSLYFRRTPTRVTRSKRHTIHLINKSLRVCFQIVSDA